MIRAKDITKLTAANFQKQTSGLLDSPAKTLALPVSKRALMAQEVACSLNLCDWFAQYDLSTSCWRTSQASLVPGMDEYRESWPKRGIMLYGLTYPLPMSAHPIKGKGGFVSAGGGGKNGRLWATPNLCGNYNRKGASKTSGDGLATQVRVQSGGQLNPTWVELLMGFPKGWTDLDCDEIGPMPTRETWRDGSWEENVPRVMAGQKARVARLKCLGNAVVPQVAEWIGRQLRVQEYMGSSYGEPVVEPVDNDGLIPQGE